MIANRIDDVFTVLGAVLACLVATLAIAESTTWPLLIVLPLTLVFGVLVGGVSRAIAGDPTHGLLGVLGRASVGVIVGVIVGELAAVVLFSGTIGHRLDDQAVLRADATPSVVAASADLQRLREERGGLDVAVAQALQQRDQALVVARCEYHPSPDCPQTHITGIPGAGPENRTANDFLADTQRELDTAVSERERQGPGLDVRIADGERAVGQARQAVVADADRGLGARWAAMHEYTAANPAALLLRLVTIAFFALLCLLPLILRLWRGVTTRDRSAAADAERARAELDADTAIAVKRAEVRAAIETMRAEQELASARMAVEAQAEIDRELTRRRVVEAISPQELGPVRVQAERVDEPDNLPARIESGSVPAVPGITKGAVRWIRPFVPPIVASAVETATKPLRGVLHVFEEEEEIHISMKRSRKVTVHADDEAEQSESVTTRAPSMISSERGEALEADRRPLPAAEQGALPGS